MMIYEEDALSELDLIYKLAPAPKLSGDSGGFEGYASVFHLLDYHNDIVAPGAYKDDAPRFLKEGFIGGVGHDHSNPIGKPHRLFEDGYGLFLDAKLVSTSKAQEARELITSDVVRKLSVGIMPMQVKTLRTKQEVVEYWKKAGWTPSEEEMMRAENGARLIKRAKLLEVSPVALPANELSEITSYKSFNPDVLADVFKRLDALEATVKGLTSVPDAEVDEYADLIQGFRQFLGVH